MPNLDPNLFSVVWQIWHTLAENIEWTPRRRRKFLKFIAAHCVLLPCNGCRDHLRANVRAVSVEKFMSGDVADWVFEFHRTVTLQIAERTFVRFHGSVTPEARAANFGRNLMTRDAVKLMYSARTTISPQDLGLLIYLFTQSDEFTEKVFASAIRSFESIVEGTGVMSREAFEESVKIAQRLGRG